MHCRNCGADMARGERTCDECGFEHERGRQRSGDGEGDSTGGIIPYKNPKALIAYYLGILSGFPFIGLPLGIAAFVLGILGLKDRAANPIIKGSVHAGIGIGCGGFFAIVWTLAIIAIAMGMASK